MYVTPLLTPSNRGSKSEFIVFVNKINIQSNKSATKFLCVKTSSGKVVAEPFPYLMVYVGGKHNLST